MEDTKLLVCDLDNTLYDWVGYFVPSFYAMVDTAVDIMSCDREQLLDDLRSVHQKFHDSEQPFALLETKTVRDYFGSVPKNVIVKALDPAFHAFNTVRKKNLRLHDGVIDGLETLRSRDIKLVAHTESRLYGALDRLHRLDLLEFFSKIYCRERSPLVHFDADAGSRWLKRFSFENIRELQNHESKPNPKLLIEICSHEHVEVGGAAYVGDSIAKDMLMAKRAGVFSIWAAYGASHDKALYSALVRISHWTQDEIVNEQKLRAEASLIQPDRVAQFSFAEVTAALN